MLTDHSPPPPHRKMFILSNPVSGGQCHLFLLTILRSSVLLCPILPFMCINVTYSPILFIHSFIHSSIHSFDHVLIHFFIHSFIHSFIYYFIYLFFHSFIQSCPFIQSFYLSTLIMNFSAYNIFCISELDIVSSSFLKLFHVFGQSRLNRCVYIIILSIVLDV